MKTNNTKNLTADANLALANTEAALATLPQSVRVDAQVDQPPSDDSKITKRVRKKKSSPRHAPPSPPPENSTDPTTGPAAANGAPPQIIDPFENVHKTLARPLETGAVGKKVVPFKVPILRRPPKGRWCTIHPEPQYRIVASLLVFDRDDVYLLNPQIASELDTEDVHRRAIIYTGILRPNCSPFLWYVPVPQAGERDNDYWKSARTAAEAGMGQWIRLISDTDAKCYHFEPADLHLWPVQWPDVPFGELLRRGFQNPGRYIDSLDHPIICELHGKAGKIS